MAIREVLDSWTGLGRDHWTHHIRSSRSPTVSTELTFPCLWGRGRGGKPKARRASALIRVLVRVLACPRALPRGASVCYIEHGPGMLVNDGYGRVWVLSGCPVSEGVGRRHTGGRIIGYLGQGGDRSGGPGGRCWERAGVFPAFWGSCRESPSKQRRGG